MMTQVLEAKDMAKKAAPQRDKAMGPLIARNLYRLGYGEMNIKSGLVAAKVSERTGKAISRQRISQLMNAARIEPETIEMLAKGLGVKVSELLREDDVTL